MQSSKLGPLKPALSRVRSFSRWIQFTALGALSVMGAGLTAHAAETIFFDLAPFGRSISIASIEKFVEDGAIDRELAPYLNRVSPETQQEIRNALNNPQQIDVAKFSQWLYEPMGERLLESTGDFVQTAGRQNGSLAIRGALLQAASEPEGLTAINALKYFPTQGIRLNLRVALRRWRAVQAAVDDTLEIVEYMRQASAEAAAADPRVDYATLPNLRQSGPLAVSVQTLNLNDTNRNRVYPADLYYPTHLNAVTGPIPVMVFSHGFGDTRSRFADFGTFVASHGFVVAVPEHIGSNLEQRQALDQWLDNESFKPGDFVDRPLDISFLLDELERLNPTTFQGRLLLDRVAVAGHSFGGYTALAIGGATVDLPRLEQRCDFSNTPHLVNVAYLLSCRALDLPPEAQQQLADGSLRDERVQLLLAFAPVSNLFGKSGMGNIQAPTLMIGGAFDIAAPVVPEQFATFSWLSVEDKYLYLAENTSHGEELTRWLGQLFNPAAKIEENFDEANAWFQGIVGSFVVAYPKVYLLGQEQYLPFLTSNYVETFSQEPFIINMVRSVSKVLPEDYTVD